VVAEMAGRLEMKRQLTIGVACLAMIAGAFFLARSQGWQFIASVFSADRAWFNKRPEGSEQVWIRRQTFVGSPKSTPPSSKNGTAEKFDRTGYQLSADLAERLRELGALELAVTPASDAPELICCRCQVEVPGTPYLRQFECRDTSADLAGDRLLKQLEKWNRR